MVAAGTQPISVTVDPSGRFAYVAADSSVYAFAINSATGALTAVGSPLATGSQPIAVTVDTLGRFVYVASSDPLDSHIYVYTINPLNGALTTVNGYWEGKSPSSVVVGPTGGFLYAAEQGSNEVVASTIDSQTGSLNAFSAVAEAGTAPSFITVDPSGRFVYATNAGNNSVSQYTIGADGGLTSMATPSVAAGTQPSSVTVVGIWQ